MNERRRSRHPLGAIGLATAGQVETLAAALEKADARIAELREALSESRAAVEQWKERAAAATREATDAAAEAKRSAAAAAKSEARAAELKSRGDALRERLDEASTRAARCVQEARLAREHLMATEVKLDLIEAAIRLLDERTRAAASREAGSVPSVMSRTT
jgi:chromosome segregation ATPase